MKIALVIDDSLDRPDGVQQFMTTVGDYFSQQGHETHYISTKSHTQIRPNIHSLGRSMKARFNGNALTMPFPIKKRKAKRLLKNEAFDVVHVQLPYSPYFSGTLVSLLPQETAVVGTFHILPYGSLASIGTRLLGMFSRRSLRRFDKIFSVSEPAKKFSKQKYGISSELMPNAVNLDYYTRKDMQTELRIVFMGRLVERKGCEYFLRMMAEISKEEPSFLIDVAGDGPQRDSLERLADTLGLTERIAFHGFVDEQTKRDLLASATLAVFPSLGGESFGIILVEAMAAGAVVLAGDNPGYRSVMHNRESQLIEPKNIQVSSQKILALLTNKQDRKKAIEWQDRLIKNYDVKTVGDKLLTEYATILKSKDKLYNTDNA